MSRQTHTPFFSSTRPEWHHDQQTCVPANITILPLPPKCPELNSTENSGSLCATIGYPRTASSNRMDDIVDHCCYAWNKLVDQPWRIMSIGLRDWAHGF